MVSEASVNFSKVENFVLEDTFRVAYFFGRKERRGAAKNAKKIIVPTLLF